jgi:hypothetical protein
MTTVDQALDAKTQFGASAAQGVNTLSNWQTVHFVLYKKIVLPLDGSVFWANTQMLRRQSIYNQMRYNAAIYNESLNDEIGQTTFDAEGSLHYATRNEETEDSTFSTNAVVFTALEPITDLNKVGPNELWIATFKGGLAPGGEIKFAFSERGSFYQQANLWHYRGNAVFSTMASQLIDEPHQLPVQPIVSNSLPGWLAINSYAPAYPVPLPFPYLPIYPAFLSPLNQKPPYATIEVEPSTEGVASIPLLSPNLSQQQLAFDDVRVTMYGANNDAALTWMKAMIQYSLDANVFGLCSIPVIRDEHKPQVELTTLAQKKSITCRVSYLQSTMRDVARQLIEEAIVTFIPGNNCRQQES